MVARPFFMSAYFEAKMSTAVGFQNEQITGKRFPSKPPRFNQRERAQKQIAYLAVYYRGTFIDQTVLRACERAKWRFVDSELLVEKGDAHNALHVAYFSRRMKPEETIYDWFVWTAQHSLKTKYNANGYPVRHAIEITGPYYAARNGGIGKVGLSSGSGDVGIVRQRERAEMVKAIRESARVMFPVMLADCMDMIENIRNAPDAEIVAQEPYPPKSWPIEHAIKRVKWETKFDSVGQPEDSKTEYFQMVSGMQVWRELCKRFPQFWAKTWNYLQSIQDDSGLPDSIRLAAADKCNNVLLMFAEKELRDTPDNQARLHGADALARAGAIHATGARLDKLIRIGNRRITDTFEEKEKIGGPDKLFIPDMPVMFPMEKLALGYNFAPIPFVSDCVEINWRPMPNADIQREISADIIIQPRKIPNKPRLTKKAIKRQLRK